MAVTPGLYFRLHYFVLVLPAMALLAGGFAASLPRAGWLWAMALAIALAVGQQSGFLFALTPLQIDRAAYGSNPFPEAIPLAEYIRAHTQAGERIAGAGLGAGYLFYAHRRSVTPYVYVYSMMEPQPYAAKMQADFMREVEAARPEYLVAVNAGASWLAWPNSHKEVLRWLGRYTGQYYRTVAVADIAHSGTTYKWDEEAASYRPRSANSVMVMRRRDGM